jgi:hypothetical protein
MRRFLIVFAAIAFCSAPTWADSIVLDVNAWATFTAPLTCLSNCTETVDVSFLYDTPSVVYENGQIVSGTLDVGSSGFLGTFSSRNESVFSGYIPFLNSGGDEIDLDWLFSSNGIGIQPGINTLSFYMWTCQSEACDNAYGEKWAGLNNAGEPSQGGSTVVAVPDGDSFLWLSLTALASIGLVWRWRRIDAT